MMYNESIPEVYIKFKGSFKRISSIRKMKIGIAITAMNIRFKIKVRWSKIRSLLI